MSRYFTIAEDLLPEVRRGYDVSVKDLLKTDKQKLYERHILNCDGDLDLMSLPVQKVLLKILEDNGLEKELIEYDNKLRKENENER